MISCFAFTLFFPDIFLLFLRFLCESFLEEVGRNPSAMFCLVSFGFACFSALEVWGEVGSDGPKTVPPLYFLFVSSWLCSVGRVLKNPTFLVFLRGCRSSKHRLGVLFRF